MYIIHEQKQKSYFWITAIYFIVFLILLLLIINPRGLNLPNIPRVSKIILGLVLLVDLAIFKSFYELFFRVTSDGLEFGYGFFKRKITKDNIESVLIDNSKGNFFGYGIRFGKDKTMGFIARTGSGLRVITKDKRKFFVTMNNPEETLSIIKQNNYV